MNQQHEQEINRAKELNPKQVTCHLQPQTEKKSQSLGNCGMQHMSQVACRRPSADQNGFQIPEATQNLGSTSFKR
jgi:hypothetical protein